MNKINTSLNVKYSFIQIFYFAIFASLIGYASVFLLDKGYSNSQIGFTLAAASICSVFLQPIVASFVDKNKNLSLNKLIIVSVAVIAILSLLLLFIQKGNFILQALFIIIVVIAMTLQPIMNALAFSFEKYGIALNFGLARGIGSVAYAVSSLLVGQLVGIFSPDYLPIFYMVAAIGLIVIIYVFHAPKGTPVVKVEQNTKVETKELTILQFVIKYKKFMFFIVGASLMFFDHMIINNFFIQVIEEVGGDSKTMGYAIFLAALLELPAMAMFTKIQTKISSGNLLKIAALFFAIKHGLTFMATSMTVIYIAQVMQMFAYALFIPASVYYVNQKIEQSDVTKGQAMATLSVTVASVFASLVGGVLLDAIGVSNVLLCGVIISIIGFVVILFSVESKN